MYLFRVFSHTCTKHLCINMNFFPVMNNVMKFSWKQYLKKKMSEIKWKTIFTFIIIVWCELSLPLLFLRHNIIIIKEPAWHDIIIFFDKDFVFFWLNNSFVGEIFFHLFLEHLRCFFLISHLSCQAFVQRF